MESKKPSDGVTPFTNGSEITRDNGKETIHSLRVDNNNRETATSAVDVEMSSAVNDMFVDHAEHDVIDSSQIMEVDQVSNSGRIRDSSGEELSSLNVTRESGEGAMSSVTDDADSSDSSTSITSVELGRSPAANIVEERKEADFFDSRYTNKVNQISKNDEDADWFGKADASGESVTRNVEGKMNGHDKSSSMGKKTQEEVMDSEGFKCSESANHTVAGISNEERNGSLCRFLVRSVSEKHADSGSSHDCDGDRSSFNNDSNRNKRSVEFKENLTGNACILEDCKQMDIISAFARDCHMPNLSPTEYSDKHIYRLPSFYAVLYSSEGSQRTFSEKLNISNHSDIGKDGFGASGISRSKHAESASTTVPLVAQDPQHSAVMENHCRTPNSSKGKDNESDSASVGPFVAQNGKDSPTGDNFITPGSTVCPSTLPYTTRSLNLSAATESDLSTPGPTNPASTVPFVAYNSNDSTATTKDDSSTPGTTNPASSVPFVAYNSNDSTATTKDDTSTQGTAKSPLAISFVTHDAAVTRMIIPDSEKDCDISELVTKAIERAQDGFPDAAVEVVVHLVNINNTRNRTVTSECHITIRALYPGQEMCPPPADRSLAQDLQVGKSCENVHSVFCLFVVIFTCSSVVDPLSYLSF